MHWSQEYAAQVTFWMMLQIDEASFTISGFFPENFVEGRGTGRTIQDKFNGCLLVDLGSTPQSAG